MIDYEKLKIKINSLQLDTLKKIANDIDSYHHIDLMIRDGGKDFRYEADFLKPIFQEIKSLLQPKPKYKIGQTVYLLNFSRPCIAIVKSINYPKYKLENCQYIDEPSYTNLDWADEHYLFPTKEDLIQAQIDYWTCLKNEETSTDSVDVSTESTKELWNECKACGDRWRFDGIYAQMILSPCRSTIDGVHEASLIPCQHESDGFEYVESVQKLILQKKLNWEAPPNIYSKKCKHCGEFYK